MQFQDEEDGDFLVPGASRSRLSSLFQGDSSSGDVNQALMFTAPKQPKKNDNAPGALKLLHAVVVHAYKLKDGGYSSEGKLGCAILGHHETSKYNLLLYKGKQVQVTVAAITSSFVFHVQPNCYANFYDEKKENWSINFDSEAVLIDFAKQVILAKANAQGSSIKSLVTQNVASGEGPTLESGDAAEVKYTGWILANYGFGQMFDSNMDSDSSFRFRLGKSKVIKGWNEGLVGAQKGEKRLLVVPPDMAYGSEGMGSIVPPNSTLIFEIHTVKVKSAHESSHSPSPIKVADSSSDKKPEVAPRQSFSQDENIKMRGASISEQLSQSPKKDKAHLISRMAKMGTATLPFQGAIAAQVGSDSESEVEAPEPSPPPAVQSVSRTSSPKPSTKPRSRTASGTTVTSLPVQQPQIHPQGSASFQPPSQVPVYDASVMPVQSPIACAAIPYPGYPPMPSHYAMLQQSSFSLQNVPPVPTSMVDSHLPMLISETRNQNTEVRISLSKITDKVDTILNKVDDMRLQGRSASVSVPFMEGTALLQNIERIVQENTRLKEEVEVKSAKIESLNEKICDLFQRNQRFFEESNSMLEQKSDSIQAVSAQSQEKILSLEQEKTRLQLDLSAISMKLSSVELDLEKYQKIESELKGKLTNAEADAETQACLLREKTDYLQDIENQLKQMTSVAWKLKNVEQEKNLLTSKIDKLEQGQNTSQEMNELLEMYKNEIEQNKKKIEELNSSLDSIPKLQKEKDKIVSELEEAVKFKAELETKCQETQKKYEIFQEKTRALKERYEKQIIELMNELKHVQATKALGTSPDFSAEIKRVMNALYKLLQGKFDANTSYQGSKILETVLQTIMGLTLQILDRKNQSSASSSVSTVSTKTSQVPKQETPSLEPDPQPELKLQNGIPSEKTPTSERTLDDSSPSNELQVEDLPVSKTDNDVLSSSEAESTQNKSISDPVINDNNDASIPKTSDTTETKPSEQTKSESPERSSSPNSLFSQPHGSKLWRPQPPLFDDDDDDDDDDDWLK